MTLADDFPSAETLPHPPKPVDGVDAEAFTYSRSKAPRLWAGEEFLGAVVLAEEELNLRYVAVTRAEAECVSALWPSPMFSELQSYQHGFPRCLRLDSLEQVLVRHQKRQEPNTPVVRSAAVLGLEELPLVPDLSGVESERKEEVLAAGCPTCPQGVIESGSDGSDSSGNQNAAANAQVAELAPPASTGCGFCWHLGALDPERVRVVVAHYQHRYPALHWDWLLPELAELRLVAEPLDGVSALAAQHQLGSVQPVIERFAQDVGLWVTKEE